MLSSIQRETQHMPQVERNHTGDKAPKQVFRNLQDLFN